MKSSTTSIKFLNQNKMRLITICCSICLIACLLPAKQVEAGRLQDFIQSIVGGNSNNNNNNSNKDKEANNANSNSNNDSVDSDSNASNESSDQQLTPMMSAMNPFMRYPSF